MSDKKRTAIVYGPPKSGKTTHADAIARALNCASVVDGWDGEPLTPNALHLTATPPLPLPGAISAEVTILPIETALAVASNVRAS